MNLKYRGRGKVAPYKIKHIRIPVPLISQINEIKKRYYEYLESPNADLENPPSFIKHT